MASIHPDKDATDSFMRTELWHMRSVIVWEEIDNEPFQSEEEDHKPKKRKKGKYLKDWENANISA